MLDAPGVEREGVEACAGGGGGALAIDAKGRGCRKGIKLLAAVEPNVTRAPYGLSPKGSGEGGLG